MFDKILYEIDEIRKELSRLQVGMKKIKENVSRNLKTCQTQSNIKLIKS